MPKDVTELLAQFELEQTGERSFRGPQPRTAMQRLFGGQVLAQTMIAASERSNPIGFPTRSTPTSSARALPTSPWTSTSR